MRARVESRRIESVLDPGGELRRGVREGVINRADVGDWAFWVVAELDEIFAAAGGAGIAVGEMRAYLAGLLDEEAARDHAPAR